MTACFCFEGGPLDGDHRHVEVDAKPEYIYIQHITGQEVLVHTYQCVEAIAVSEWYRARFTYRWNPHLTRCTEVSKL